MTDISESEKTVAVRKVTSAGSMTENDRLAVEEPMEIRIVFGPHEKRTGRSLSITMRTPNHDFELAAGFLFTEGIISGADQIEKMEFCGPVAEGRQFGNIVRAYLHEDVIVAMEKLQRHFYTTSSCGICGKASLDAISSQGLHAIPHSQLQLKSKTICDLPERLRSSQRVFDRTGGIHAAGLFNPGGDLECVREDVGRHNAVDKLIGCQLTAGHVPLVDKIIVVSGRASFELMQKALVASIPVLVAVGAPSSLAVDLAREFNMTLIGFTSSDRFNVYSGEERVIA